MKMKIVGLGTKVLIQTMKDNNWKPNNIDRNEFEDLMRNEFPGYVAEYEKDNINCDMVDFFYHYGETNAMIKKGEAYIFQS